MGSPTEAASSPAQPAFGTAAAGTRDAAGHTLGTAAAVTRDAAGHTLGTAAATTATREASVTRVLDRPGSRMSACDFWPAIAGQKSHGERSGVSRDSAVPAPPAVWGTLHGGPRDS